MPDRSSYQLSLLAAQRLLKVPRLGGVVWAKYPDGKPMIWSGAYAAVFQGTDAQGRQWALRCPLQDFANSDQQHRIMGEYLARSPLPYLIQFEYTPRGFVVDGVAQPVTVSEWVRGPSIKTFVGQNLRAAAKVRLAWERIARDMVDRGIAHGDIHHDNVLVEGNMDAPSMRLIDYDSFVVPANVGQVEGIAGAPDYQHPNRRTMNRKHPRVDAFSMLVMDLTLRALAECPSLWNDLKLDIKSEGFLLGQEDYRSPKTSKVFRRLLALGGAVEILARGVKRALADPDPLRSPYPWELVGVSDRPPIEVRPAPNTAPSWMTAVRPTPQLPAPSLAAAAAPAAVRGPTGRPSWMVQNGASVSMSSGAGPVVAAATPSTAAVAAAVPTAAATTRGSVAASAITQRVMPRGLRVLCIVGLVLCGLSFLTNLLRLGVNGGSFMLSYALVRDALCVTACSGVLARIDFGFRLLRWVLAIDLIFAVVVYPIWLFKYSGMHVSEMTTLVVIGSTIWVLLIAAALAYLNLAEVKGYQASLKHP